MAEPICLQVPICLFDAKSKVLRPQCEAVLQTGIDSVVNIVKELRHLDITIEFEDGNR
jgi:hypothetical protein